VGRRLPPVQLQVSALSRVEFALQLAEVQRGHRLSVNAVDRVSGPHEARTLRSAPVRERRDLHAAVLALAQEQADAELLLLGAWEGGGGVCLRLWERLAPRDVGRRRGLLGRWGAVGLRLGGRGVAGWGRAVRVRLGLGGVGVGLGGVGVGLRAMGMRLGGVGVGLGGVGVGLRGVAVGLGVRRAVGVWLGRRLRLWVVVGGRRVAVGLRI